MRIADQAKVSIKTGADNKSVVSGVNLLAAAEYWSNCNTARRACKFAAPIGSDNAQFRDMFVSACCTPDAVHLIKRIYSDG